LFITVKKEGKESEVWRCPTNILFDSLEVGVVERKVEVLSSLTLGLIHQKIV
jgi:hypothetical protein